MWWIQLTGSWNWTEEAKYEEEENSCHSDHTSGSHVDSAEKQLRTCWTRNLCLYILKALLIFFVTCGS